MVETKQERRRRINSLHNSIGDWVNKDLGLDIDEYYIDNPDSIEMLIQSMNGLRFISNKRYYKFIVKTEKEEQNKLFNLNMYLVALDTDYTLSYTIKIPYDMDVVESYNKMFEGISWLMSWCNRNNVIYVDTLTPIFTYEKAFMNKKINNKVKFINLYDGNIYMKSNNKLIMIGKKNRPKTINEVSDCYYCVASSYYITLSLYNKLNEERCKKI